MFPGAALFLASFGLYSVISYGVTQRTREIGLRVALGAQGSDIARLVLKDGVLLTVGGLITGLLGAVLLSDLMVAFLYGIDRTDPITLASVSAASPYSGRLPPPPLLLHDMPGRP